jgi:hypothetical protein
MANIMQRMKKMTKLTTAARNKLKKSQFAIPSERKYPIENRAHAVNAKARASQMEKKGKISESEKKLIDKKANEVLKRKK